MTQDVDLEAFLGGFVAECGEHLRTSRKAILELDSVLEGAPHRRAGRELFRALHTMKGLAAMVGVEPLVELLHQMETVLREAEESGGRLPSESLDVLVRALEAVEERVREVSRGDRVSGAPKTLLAELERLRPPTAESAIVSGLRLLLEPELAAKLTTAERAQIAEGVRAGRRALRLTFSPSAERSDRGVHITWVRERAASLGELVRVLPVSLARTDEAPGGLAFVLLILTEADDARVRESIGEDGVWGPEPLVETADPHEPEEPSEDGPHELSAGDVVRVGVSRLDEALVRLSGGIVSRSRVERAIDGLAADGADVRELRTAMAEHTRQLRDLREAILQLRMVSVAEVLEPIPLLVRGLRSTTGKLAHVRMDVAHAELDKAVADLVFPAIVHLVRNAVDHGIEAPEHRRAAGKPEEGCVTIRARAVGAGLIELSVGDDGAGVDPDAVARAAGVPVPTSEQGLLAVLVQAGMSTRAEANRTSGRGMGLDIVHRLVAQKLGGELRLESRAGVGATFVLRIPLTLSIVDGLRFRCADRCFVVPLSSVEQVLDLVATPAVTAPDPHRRARSVRLIEHHGAVVPLVSLHELFGLGDGAGAHQGMLIRHEGQGYAFGIDQLLGLGEVVVRPLEDPLVRVPGVAGATDLGDGRPTLVLDLPALAARFSGEWVSA